MSENKIKDYISGIEIKATPEEIDSVQVFSKILVEEYGYDKEQIQTRPQFRVKRSPSDNKKAFPVDIAIFKDNNKKEKDLYIVVECKKKNRKDGREQLENYLSLSTANLGVWFNGEERLFLRKIQTDKGQHFEEIPNIPVKGQRVEDVGLFKKEDLKIPHSLKPVFHSIRNYVAANAIGVTRDEVISQQIINIVFCKIYDEKFKSNDQIMDFRAGVGEKPEDVKKRIDDLFNQVKSKYTDVLAVTDKIILDPKTVYYVVGELQLFSLLDAERDVIADAFETFTGYSLKGTQGQFFTPINVVKLLVEIIDPKPNEIFIDPACGSGSFLLQTLKHMWSILDEDAKKFSWSNSALIEEKNATAIKNIHGIEKDDFLSKISKAYMAIMGDGKGGIFCEDSLCEPKDWKRTTSNRVSLEKFDVVLANPPFGKDIKVVGKEKISQFKLGHKWENKNGTNEMTSKVKEEENIQILFIERCFQLLSDGGRLGIILPETIFHGPKYSYVREYITKNNNITHIIDLPHNTFRPHNNAKCLAIIIEKNVTQQEEILMSVAEEIGHDHNGQVIQRWNSQEDAFDIDNVWDDLPIILEELKGLRDRKYTFYVDSETVLESGILVPRYFWNLQHKKLEDYAERTNSTLVKVDELIKEGVLGFFDGHGSPPSQFKGKGDIPYVRVKDIVNWEMYKDPTSLIPKDIYEKIKGKTKQLKENDIVFVRRGSYRIGSVGLVTKYDLESLLTREILVLRATDQENDYNINPYYLLYLLSHETVKEQIKNKVLIETTLPNIGDRWKEILLPIHNNSEEIKNITEKVKSVFVKKNAVLDELHKLRTDLGGLTT